MTSSSDTYEPRAEGVRHTEVPAHAATSRVSRGGFNPEVPIPPTDAQSGRPVVCRLAELASHPSYIRNNIVIPVSQLTLLARSGDALFREPIIITANKTILDGYARVHLARQQKLLALPALEYDFSESAALQWMLHKHRRSNGLNAFNRISLALELESEFREQAISNQKLGGQRKGSSNLPEAYRVDVRSEIAAAAGVSSGNISKVKRLIAGAHPHVLRALRSGEISINQASTWLLSPSDQLAQLLLYQGRRGISKTIRDLLKKHRRPLADREADLRRIGDAIAGMNSDETKDVLIAEVKIPVNVLLLSTSLLRVLTRQCELDI